jgi:hypothetical protein
VKEDRIFGMRVFANNNLESGKAWLVGRDPDDPGKALVVSEQAVYEVFSCVEDCDGVTIKVRNRNNGIVAESFTSWDKVPFGQRKPDKMRFFNADGTEITSESVKRNNLELMNKNLCYRSYPRLHDDDWGPTP